MRFFQFLRFLISTRYSRRKYKKYEKYLDDLREEQNTFKERVKRELMSLLPSVLFSFLE